MCRLQRSALLLFVPTAFAALGCAADADQPGRASNGITGAVPGATDSGGGAAGGGSEDDAFGNADNPLPPVTGTGGGGNQEPRPVMMGECAAVSQAADNRLQPADIIFGIDTSGSMDEEAGFVQQNMNAFSQQIIDSGVDVRVILVARQVPSMDPAQDPGFFGGGDDDDFGICIDAPLGSGSCPADSNPPVYTHINQEVGSNDVLGILINAYPSYRDQLRPESLKTFVSVTDDDATDPPISSADGFIAAVQGLDPNGATWTDWRYSSIYCFTQCEQAAEVGAVHADLVSKTGGVGGDLCLQDFGPVFDELARQVVEGVQLACDWEIPAAPMGEVFDATRTNVELTLDGTSALLAKAPTQGECNERGGWHYDDEAAPSRVHACPATCTQIQAASSANVDILFGCATQVLE